MTRKLLLPMVLWLCAVAQAQSITNLNYNTGSHTLSFTLNNVAPGCKVEVLVDGVSQILSDAPEGTTEASMEILIPPPGGKVTVRLLQYATDNDGVIIPGPPTLAAEESIVVDY